jgi:hypothetical protein
VNPVMICFNDSGTFQGQGVIAFEAESEPPGARPPSVLITAGRAAQAVS